jgi:N-6 DNA Methylase
VDPEQRGALEGWEATPHQQLERLLRETGVSTGLLLTDGELRVIHAPRGETSGWLKFPIRSLGEVGGRPMLGGLKLILSSFRLHNDAPERRLTSLLKASREAQAEVSTRLAAQVLGALYELLRGLHSADRSRIEALAASRPDHLYEGLLTVLLRLVFLLYAEDRDLIPSRSDGEARALYDQGYGVRSLYTRLLEDAAHHPDTMDERRGGWSRLLALFRLVYRGDGRGWIRARRGKLFDPDAFPFLQGQDNPSDQPSPATVSDGCVLRILDLLLSLDSEKLSYRTLDVEQIGSVYEAVMGFTVETRPGPTLAIRAGKNDRTPVFVDVAALTAKKGSERAKFLKEEADRGSLTDKVGKPLAAATDQTAFIAALRPIADERASPGGHVAPPGTPLLQPTDERRRTGSHYTPRSLTAPIVKRALEPAFARLGPDAKPEAVLDLKVCDPAMGSGAFLVEACRVFGERLVQAWARWPETRPMIPPDEDEHLHARRLVAQRCLYGVDKNPRAVDLARLSLWLATLARDHEFTFLDHALKCGDSLVGLTAAQIAATHWDTSKPPTFVGKLVSDHLKAAEEGRAQIRDHADGATEAELRPLLKAVDAKLEVARLIGDGVLAAFFHTDKPRERIKRLVEFQKSVQSHLGSTEWLTAIAPFAAPLRLGAHPVPPFHWPVEFPEVFARNNAGFDAIVGNPPFAGKNTIIAGHRKNYLLWLQTLNEGAHGNSDLVAHFFRRAFGLLRKGACFGLIATNTIGQGDTRATGLTTILATGGSIRRAVKRLQWPGEAAVVVSVVHVKKGPVRSAVLDGRQLSRISAYLVEGEMDGAPARLAENARKAFQGSILLGMGFTFDDGAAAKGEAESLAAMRALIDKDPHNNKRIFPYVGGEEVNNSPTHAHHRYTIDFADFPLRRDKALPHWKTMSEDARETVLRKGVVPLDYTEPVAADWPALLEIVERLVKPVRATNPDRTRREIWWQRTRRVPALKKAIASLHQVLVTNCGAAPHMAIALTTSGSVFANTLAVFAFGNLSPFATLQSRIHEIWARFFASSMKDDLRYTPSDCFETFPFPEGFETSPTLEAAGRAYHDHRATLMVASNEGMTKTYNRFHDPYECGEEIIRMRELHAEMDHAVLRAYGWDDLAAHAKPVFLDATGDDDHTYQGRLFWPAALRDEVLTRLLALNAQRAVAESEGGVPLAVVPDSGTQEQEAAD